MEEFEGYFQGSPREQFISALNKHRTYFDNNDFNLMPYICGVNFGPKLNEIDEVIEEMVKVASNITDDEFGNALDNIKALGPLLINFYKYDLDEKENQVLAEKSLMDRMSDFLDEFVLNNTEWKIEELKKMQWVSEVPLNISDLNPELASIFFQYDRLRYNEFKMEVM